jgi:TonB family protein
MLKPVLVATLLTGSAQAAEIVPLSCAPQIYTPEALRYEMEGSVKLELALDKDGTPITPTLLRGSGYALLDRNAINHVSSCKFPAAEHPAGVRHTSTVVWRLPEGRSEVVSRFLPQTCLNKYKIFTPAGLSINNDYLTIRTQVWPDGRPYTAKVEHSSGEPEVDTLAVNYLENCRFDPALRNGQAAHGAVLLTVQLDRTVFDEAKVHSFYDSIIAGIGRQNEYKVAHILYASEDAARIAIATLRDGAHFGPLAKLESLDKASGKVDGELGWVLADQMVPTFSSSLKAQKIAGMIDRPVHTALGWHVVLVEDIRTITPPTYDALRNHLRSRLIRETNITVQVPPARPQ